MKGPFEVYTATEKLNTYKMQGTDKILTDQIQAGGEALYSKIHNLINL